MKWLGVMIHPMDGQLCITVLSPSYLNPNLSSRTLALILTISRTRRQNFVPGII